MENTPIVIPKFAKSILKGNPRLTHVTAVVILSVFDRKVHKHVANDVQDALSQIETRNMSQTFYHKSDVLISYFCFTV